MLSQFEHVLGNLEEFTGQLSKELQQLEYVSSLSSRPSWERCAIVPTHAATYLTTLESVITHTPIHKKSVVIYHSARN